MNMNEANTEKEGLFGKPQGLDLRVAAKKEEFKQRARRVIAEQFDRDQKNMDAIDEGYESLKKYQGISLDNSKEIAGLLYSQKAMREEYGISEDSQEYIDTQIMLKARNNESLTEEEGAQYKVILAEQFGRSTPLRPQEWRDLGQLEPPPSLTMYQYKCLGDEDMRDIYEAEITEAVKGIRSANAQIQSAKDAAAQDNMADAQAAKEEIEQMGSDIIVGMISDEAVKHVEEELEETVDAARDAAEEKEALEKEAAERDIEQAKQEQQVEEIRDTTEVISEGENAADDIKAKLTRIIEETDLPEEDQKGILIDRSL